MALTHVPPDFKEFLRLLSAHQVEYLLIGGYPRPAGQDRDRHKHFMCPVRGCCGWKGSRTLAPGHLSQQWLRRIERGVGWPLRLTHRVMV
jgi:hypothetical protein